MKSLACYSPRTEEGSVAQPEAKYSAGPVGPKRRIELKLNLLINDIGSDARLSLLGLALLDKLFGVKLYRQLCKQATEESSSMFLKEKKEKSGVVSGIGISRAYAAAHLESFLYSIGGAFDVLASIALHLCPNDAETLTDRYFKNQMKTIIDHPKISPEYVIAR